MQLGSFRRREQTVSWSQGAPFLLGASAETLADNKQEFVGIATEWLKSEKDAKEHFLMCVSKKLSFAADYKYESEESGSIGTNSIKTWNRQNVGNRSRKHESSWQTSKT
jgi:hypothetical protein